MIQVRFFVIAWHTQNLITVANISCFEMGEPDQRAENHVVHKSHTMWEQGSSTCSNRRIDILTCVPLVFVFLQVFSVDSWDGAVNMLDLGTRQPPLATPWYMICVSNTPSSRKTSLQVEAANQRRERTPQESWILLVGSLQATIISVWWKERSSSGLQ